MARETELAAKAFGVQLDDFDVTDPKDIGTAFQAAIKGRAEALLVLQSGILSSRRKQIVELAAKNRLPAIYHYSEFVEAGGLMSYGPDNTDVWRRAADLRRQDSRKAHKSADLAGTSSRRSSSSS